MSFLSNAIAQLAGAPEAANTAQGFYSPYMNQLWNPNGSPAAQQYIGQTAAGLKPEFEDQNKSLLAELNATGIANSGAAKANLQDLVGRQSSAVAGATAPFYGQALGEYGNLAGASAGAQENAYSGALSQFWQNLRAGASDAAGVPSSGGGAAPNPAQPYDVSYDPYATATTTGGSPDYNPYGGSGPQQ